MNNTGSLTYDKFQTFGTNPHLIRLRKINDMTFIVLNPQPTYVRVHQSPLIFKNHVLPSVKMLHMG